MNEPKPGWTVERVLDMLDQGYQAEHVATVSGFALAFVEAQCTPRAAGVSAARRDGS